MMSGRNLTEGLSYTIVPDKINTIYDQRITDGVDIARGRT